ncbi:MAG TPA: type II secretion system F family protein [Steroidobacteraceae bacterium]|nr:type II secretion system F family protein [Steroidobacteraceae bacterium]
MGEAPVLVMMLLIGGMAVLSVAGLRGLLAIQAALHDADFARLEAPPHWPATRAFGGLCMALPVYFAVSSLGAGAWVATTLVAGLGYAVAPRFVDEIRRRAEQALLDELALHLDLIALAVEAGSSLPSALAICAERAPDGPLRRCWSRAVLEMHAGAPPQDVLRDLDQHIGLRPFSTLVMALRAAERAGVSAAVVLRERARQAAAARFARAERLARAAPLKLWATMVLCIAPCTLLVLAFPLAQLLALLVD